MNTFLLLIGWLTIWFGLDSGHWLAILLGLIPALSGLNGLLRDIAGLFNPDHADG